MLYIADIKNEIHSDKNAASNPSQIELIEDNFISPNPKQFFFVIL